MYVPAENHSEMKQWGLQSLEAEMFEYRINLLCLSYVQQQGLPDYDNLVRPNSPHPL